MSEDSKISKAQQKAVNKYVKNNYDRINVTFPKGQKEKLREHAQKQDESVNAFIVRSVLETMNRDNSKDSTAAPVLEDTTQAPNSPKTAAKTQKADKSLEPQPGSKRIKSAPAASSQNNAGIPSFLTEEILGKIDAKRFLSDAMYQIEIGNAIGMKNLSSLAEYLKGTVGETADTANHENPENHTANAGAATEGPVNKYIRKTIDRIANDTKQISSDKE